MIYFPKCEGKGSFPKSQIKSLILCINKRAWHFVWPDLCPKHLQKLSADMTLGDKELLQRLSKIFNHLFFLQYSVFTYIND